MDRQNDDRPFSLTVDLNVLDHLADGLYSSVAAVLTEAVANAWDADAKEVHVEIDVGAGRIAIQDLGRGMSHADVNDRYLRVGYRKRDLEGNMTPGGRPVMGRKGIGKLSLLSIADAVEIFTRTEGGAPLGLAISVPDLRKVMHAGESEYHPSPLNPSSDDAPHPHGTRIQLAKLKVDRLRETSSDSVRRRLARRFSVIGSHDFRVFVNGSEVGPHDRNDQKFTEYVWVIGDRTPHDLQHAKRTSHLAERASDWPSSWSVSGWVGTVEKPRQLSTAEGNLNSIVVLARGRLVHEDILSRVSSGELYTKYLTGQIDADFLDDSDSPDIVTSNRQSLIEYDERFGLLVEFVRISLRKIASQWDEWRIADRAKISRDRFPALAAWLGSLPEGWRKKAETLLARIAAMDLRDDETSDEEARRTLLRHAILGFERLRVRGDAEEIERALTAGSAEQLIALLADKDAFEASLYLDIVRSRLEAIRAFETLVDSDQKERVLQKYLFDHLWLLDPSWERATGSEEIERRLRLRPEFQDDAETKDRFGRVDIRYRTVAGKHVILELKRASVRPSIDQLLEQGLKYVKALREIVGVQALIEVVFVLGNTINEDQNTIESTMRAISSGSRIVTYEQLIIGARQAYAEFSQKAANVDRIDTLLRQLD